jgi:hypothetical protein
VYKFLIPKSPPGTNSPPSSATGILLSDPYG